MPKNFPSCAYARERTHTRETLQTEESIKQLLSDFQVLGISAYQLYKKSAKKRLKTDSRAIHGAGFQSNFRNQAYAPLVCLETL